MLGHRDLNMEDYLGILRRRLWCLVIPAVIGPAIGYAVSFQFPEKYTSQTLVLVEQQKVPDRFVASVVSDDFGQRLGTMKEQILSRSRLQPIIENTSLYKEDRQKVTMEDLIARMRKDVLVKPVESIGSNKAGLSGFSISFTVDDARMAQAVCQQITSMFIEENLKIRESKAENTTQFLRTQLDEAKRRLDEQDARLAVFKRKYIGQLPGQEGANLSLLMGSNTQLEAVTQLISRTQQDKTYTETLFAQQVAAWESAQAGNSPQTLDQQLGVLQNQMVTMEARYTADHPDVIKLKADIAQLKKKINEVNAAAKDKPADKTQQAALVEPPQIQGLRNQIRIFEQTLAEKTREQNRLQEQIKIYQARVQLSPAIEQEYKEMNRGYETALGFYNDLLSKKTQSEISTNLERQQQGEQFSLLDPANLPERPTFPNRPLFAAGGLGGGLGLGFGLALLLEMRDKSLRNEADVEFYLELPALAMLPTVGEANGRSRGFLKRKHKEAAQAGQSARA